MKFEEVLPALRAGKRIRREAWGHGVIFQKDSIQSTSILPGSLIAEDWLVMKEPFDHTKLKHGDKFLLKPSIEKFPPHREVFYLGPALESESFLYTGSIGGIVKYANDCDCEFID